jgi:hypothetical protein
MGDARCAGGRDHHKECLHIYLRPSARRAAHLARAHTPALLGPCPHVSC